MLLKDGRAYSAAMNNQALYIAAQDGLNDVVTLLLADNRVIEEVGWRLPLRLRLCGLSEQTSMGHALRPLRPAFSRVFTT